MAANCTRRMGGWGPWVLGLVLLSCAEGGENGGAPPTDLPTSGIAPGLPGGACLEGGTCTGPGLYCGDGVCREATCSAGEEGCACFANWTCSRQPDGRWLTCEAGVCRQPACPQGEVGCGCTDAGTCEAGLACTAQGETARRCQPPDCSAGEAGCVCRVDRTCDATGEAALACVEGICEETDCTIGEAGCACHPDYRCDAGLACGDAGLCESPSCPTGQLGCACPAVGACDGGLYCAGDGTCQSPSCTQGEADCGCFANHSCTEPEDGTLLVCRGGRCVDGECEPGQIECACQTGGSCAGASLSCIDGLCVPADCISGDEDCPCGGGGTCDASLTCIDHICRSSEGREGGACLTNGTCLAGNRCDSGTCVACLAGTTGCNCTSEGACAAGLECNAGLCIAEEVLVPTVPVDPVCYSPCTEDIPLPGGGLADCDPDGLAPYCPEGTDCVEGSCVPEGSGPRICEAPTDCPDFQTCILGQCYSECELSSDCREGLTCHRHVCRAPCLASGAPCAGERICETSDGDAGVCVEPVPPAGPTPAPVTGAFAVYPAHIELTGARTRAAITIENLSERGFDFTLRKVSHLEYTDAGLRTETELPLFWMTLGVAPLIFDDDGGLLPVDEEQRRAVATVETDPAQSVTFFVEGNGGRRTIVLGDAANEDLPRWEGVVRVEQAVLGGHDVQLTYASVPEGQWDGSIYYFGNFRDNNFDGSGGWLSNLDSPSAAAATQNAFVRRWVDLRSNAITLEEWLAVTHATTSGSWAFPSVREVCARAPGADVPGAGLPNGACYLYDNVQGFSVYSNNVSALAVPSGVIELPVSMNLRPVPGGAANEYEGRINSDVALQYAGYPAVALTFVNDPLECTRGGSNCLVDIVGLEATVQVGARYRTTPDDTACASGSGGGFDVADIPWLVLGFHADTTFDPASGRRYQHECRDTLLPLGTDAAELNASLAAANPIPDGRPRVRHIELVDGMLINQETLYIIFREWYEQFLGSDGGDEPPFSAYGVMVLQRAPATLDEADYAGNDVDDDRQPGYEPGLEVACSDALIADVLGPGAVVDDAEVAAELAWGLVTGMPVVPAEPPLTWDPESLTDEQVHYYCEDTGTIDNRVVNPGTGSVRLIPCPPGSRVTYFTTRGIAQSTIDRLACQQTVAVRPAPPEITALGSVVNVVNQQSTVELEIDPSTGEPRRGTCQAALNQWVAEGRYDVRLNPAWQCADPGTGAPLAQGAFCDNVRLDPSPGIEYDLRYGKLFYPEQAAEAVFSPVDAEIGDAFRYKVRFRSRSGQNLGFTPEICIPDSDEIPYCYDPAAIEGIRDRVDCAVDVYTTWFDELDEGTLTLLSEFLTTTFSYVSGYDRCRQLGGGIDECSQVDPVLHYDGFERLYSELLVMLGDEALTQALGSRFDLAGTRLATFEGGLLEPGGIELSGGAGFEMVLLYRAAQYYEMVLDRFYRLTPVLWEVGRPETDFVTAATATTYMERLVLASTKLTRAWSEIARRYQSFNRPELARLVIERAYTRAYLESIALTRMMQRIIRAVDISEMPEVQRLIDDTQRRYRIAMLDMTEAHRSIVDEVNFFGFPADYIPFPGLRETDENAVRLLLDRAESAVRFAAEREQVALQSTRAFDTDAAQFQSEMAEVGQQYEDQLAELCGTFEGTDGNIYPAIPRYAEHLDSRAPRANMPPMLQNPCGLVGNGRLFEADAELSIAALAMDASLQTYESTVAEIEIVRQQTAGRCGLLLEDATWEASSANHRIGLQVAMQAFQTTANNASRMQASTLTIMQNTFATARACNPISVSGSFGGLLGSTGSSSSANQTSRSTSSGLGPSWGGNLGLNPAACLLTAAAAPLNIALVSANNNIAASTEQAVNLAQLDIAAIQRDIVFNQLVGQCDYARLEANGEIQRLWLRLAQNQIDLLQQQYALHLAEAEVTSRTHQAIRLMAQQEDAEQLLINVEAARNDPNVRIYQNAAVLRADRSFRDALRAVYRATRVFEYYSSQSYDRTDELFLVRMVSEGEVNLEDYLTALEQSYFDFRADFGVPDTRVAIVSLRDDMLGIPRLDEDGTAYSFAERADLLRTAMRDVGRLDSGGWLSIPFATTLDVLSPLTRNHKLLFVEAEIVGSDVGDTLGRLYVRQRGTGTVASVTGSRQFYAFPETLAVLNPFFNGERLFTPEVYRSARLRDRPFANTHWELLFNQRDETVNQDINIGSLTDIRLYLYYTDFSDL